MQGAQRRLSRIEIRWSEGVKNEVLVLKRNGLVFAFECDDDVREGTHAQLDEAGIERVQIKLDEDAE